MRSIDEMIYRGLWKEGLLYNADIAVEYSIHLSYYRCMVEEEPWFQKFPQELKKRYELNVSINCMKYVLAAKSFGRPLEAGAVSAAVAFVLAGCCLDHMLDDGIEEERQLALEKLDWDYCAHYFVTFGIRKSQHPVDMLYEVVGRFLAEKSASSYGPYEKLIRYLKRAVVSERCSACGSGAASDECVVRDKSVLFVVIGFLLALYGRHDPEEEKVFFLIGDIFRSIDDLCDFEEDKHAGRVNSLSAQKFHEDISDTVKITEELQRLHGSLQQLRSSIALPFYNLIQFELQLWTLDNPYIFREFLDGK